MKAGVLKYLTIVFILLGILERSDIPVVSLFANQSYKTEVSCNQCAEDPVKESENIKEFSAKEYIHQFIAYELTLPVFYLYVNQQAMLKTQFPHCFYPDVLTPPPNS